MRSRPAPPRPASIRTPEEGFGWLDARLLRDRWLPELGSDAIAVLAFLSLAADRDGVSYYARDRMVVEVGLDVSRLDRALDLLQQVDLVAHRPWRRGRRDGVWQLLPVPRRTPTRKNGGTASAADILRDLGLTPPEQERGS